VVSTIKTQFSIKGNGPNHRHKIQEDARGPRDAEHLNNRGIFAGIKMYHDSRALSIRQKRGCASDLTAHLVYATVELSTVD